MKRLIGKLSNLFFYFIYRSWVNGNAVILLASGDKLSPLIDRYENYKVVYVEKEFNFEKLRYCFQNGMAYLVDPDISSLRFDDVALSEDYAQYRRSIAEAAENRCIPVCVLSHGFPYILEDLGPQRSARTFVRSLSEYNHYLHAGYDADKLVIIPDLFNAKLKNYRWKILYCIGANYNIPQDVKLPSMCLREFHGKQNEIYTRDLFECLKQLNTEIRLKPHYNEEKKWTKWINRQKFGLPYKMESHRKDIEDLIAWADIVVTPISSVIHEAKILKRAVIVFQYEHKIDEWGPPLTDQYLSKNTYLANNKEELMQHLITITKRTP